MATSDPDIQTDACPEAEEKAQTNITAEPETEYFDGVLVYADDDYDIAVWILAFMTNIKLADGTCPKVVLHEHAKFNVAKVEKSEKVLKCCSFVFVVATKQLSKDNYADYIKDEAIADTRINDDIPAHQRYRVIPLHTKAKGERDYKIPIGLRSIQPFDVYDEKCKRSQNRLRQLFDEGYLIYRRLTVRPMHKQKSQTPEENGDTYRDRIDNHPEHGIHSNILAPKDNNMMLESTLQNLTVSKNEAEQVSSFDHEHLDLQSAYLSMDGPGIKQGCKGRSQKKMFSVKEQVGSSEGQPGRGTGNDKHEKRKLKCNSDHYPVEPSDHDFRNTNTPEETEIRNTEQTGDVTSPKVAHSDLGKQSDNQSKKRNKGKRVNNKETNLPPNNKETNLPPNTLVLAQITDDDRQGETEEVAEACKSTPEVRVVTADEAKGTATSIPLDLQRFDNPTNQRRTFANELEEADRNLLQSTMGSENIKEKENEDQNSKKVIKAENLKRGSDPKDNYAEHNIQTQNQCMGNQNLSHNERRRMPTLRSQSPFRNADNQYGNIFTGPNKQEQFSNGHSELSNVHRVSMDHQHKVLLGQEQKSFRFDEHENASIQQDNNSFAPKENNKTLESTAKNLNVSEKEATEVSRFDPKHLDLQSTDLSMDEPRLKQTGTSVKPSDHDFHDTITPAESEIRNREQSEDMTFSKVAHSDHGKEADDQSKKGNKGKQVDTTETNLPLNTLVLAEFTNNTRHAETEKVADTCKSTPEVCEVTADEAKDIVTFIPNDLQGFDKPASHRRALGNDVEESDRNLSQSAIGSENINDDRQAETEEVAEACKSTPGVREVTADEAKGTATSVPHDLQRFDNPTNQRRALGNEVEESDRNLSQSAMGSENIKEKENACQNRKNVIEAENLKRGSDPRDNHAEHNIQTQNQCMGNQNLSDNERRRMPTQRSQSPFRNADNQDGNIVTGPNKQEEVAEACKSRPEVREVTADVAKGTGTSVPSEHQGFDKPTNQRHALGNELEESDCNLSKSITGSETTKENENEGQNSRRAVEVENLKRESETTKTNPLNASDTRTHILPISSVSQNTETALATPRTNCTANSYLSLNSTEENLNGFKTTDRIPEEPPLDKADESPANSTLQKDRPVTRPERDTDTKGSEQIYAENSIPDTTNVQCVETKHKPFFQRMIKEQPLRCSDPMYNAAITTTPDAQHRKDCSKKIVNNLNTSTDEKQDHTPEGSSDNISNTNYPTRPKQKLVLPVQFTRSKSSFSKTDSMQEEGCLNGATLAEIQRKKAKCPQEHDERDLCSQEETLRNEASSSSNKILSADELGKETKDHDFGNSSKMDFAKKKGITLFAPCRENSDINTPVTKEPVGRYHLERENIQGNESANRSNLPHISAEEKQKEPSERESTAIHTYSSARNDIHAQIIIHGAANIMIGNRNQLFDQRNDNPGEPQDMSPEASVPEHEQEKLPLRQLSSDGIPSAPHQDLQPFTGGPKGHLPSYPDVDSKLIPESKEGREEALSCLPSLPSHNDLIDDLSGNEEKTEEDGFLPMDEEEPSRKDKRCFLCCWKK